jgi:hypothetical protein
MQLNPKTHLQQLLPKIAEPLIKCLLLTQQAPTACLTGFQQKSSQKPGGECNNTFKAESKLTYRTNHHQQPDHPTREL